MTVKIRYNQRGDPIAVKIDQDGWIYNEGWPVGYFRQIIKRALKYDVWQQKRGEDGLKWE